MVEKRSIFEYRYFYPILLLISVSSVVLLWYLFPLFLNKLGIQGENRGVFGDQFGSLNALFTGLAFALLICTTLMQSRELTFQRRELKLTREAFSEARELEAANLAGSLLLPIFQYTRTSCGASLAILAREWRSCSTDVLGFESNTLVQRMKNNFDDDQVQADLSKVQSRLATKFQDLKLKQRTNPLSLSDAARLQIEDWDEARRNISLVAQQVFQIREAKLVNKVEVLRVSAFADFVATYKFCCYPLDFSIELGRVKEAKEYPPGQAFIEIYSHKELIDAFY